MKKRVAYYQGCSLEGLAVEYDISTRALCEALDVELVEIPDWSCCGSTPLSAIEECCQRAWTWLGHGRCLPGKSGP